MNSPSSRCDAIEAIYRDTARETFDLMNELDKVMGRSVGRWELQNKAGLLAEARLPRDTDRADWSQLSDATPAHGPTCCRCNLRAPRLVKARGAKADHCHQCAQLVRRMYQPW